MTPTQPLAASRSRSTTRHAAHPDQTPARGMFLLDILKGLRAHPKTLPSKYFYDERGSALFDQICTLPEYYLTRAEIAIMRRHAPDMARLIDKDALIFELGSGSGVKTRLLLDHLEGPATYVPIDISREHLLRSADSLARLYPHIEVIPLWADYTKPFTLPTPAAAASDRIAYFPGSTIGNLHEREARRLLSRLAQVCRPGGALLIGFDLVKDRALLEAAYNDSRGITAEFNLNLLRRINCELEADIDAEAFDFRAIWNAKRSRIESYLISRADQSIHLCGDQATLKRGERIRTECSYKYTIHGFAKLAATAGWRMKRWWTDGARRFAVALLGA